MHRERFPVQFSALSGRALEERILGRNPIMKLSRCKLFTLGLNDICIVKTPAGTYYLRVSAYKRRTKEEWEAGTELPDYLNNKGYFLILYTAVYLV